MSRIYFTGRKSTTSNLATPISKTHQCHELRTASPESLRQLLRQWHIFGWHHKPLTSPKHYKLFACFLIFSNSKVSKMIWPNNATLAPVGSLLWDSLQRGLSRFNASGNPLRLLIAREILWDCCKFEDINVWVFEQRTGAARLEGTLTTTKHRGRCAGGETNHSRAKRDRVPQAALKGWA